MPRQRSQNPLIKTKLNRPAADSRWVERPRLIARLEEGLKKRVTLISAGAGYGKTTLIVQWLNQVPGNSAWLSLDKNDSYPDRFLRYVIAAVRTVAPEFGSEIEPFLTFPELPPPDYLADILISELVSLKETLVIVLEDFHTIDCEPVQMMLTRLIVFLPDHLHLVISTRVDPPLPLAHWRVRSWIEEFRAADLRFSKEEARIFFAQSLKKPLSAETVERLRSQTEGWVAGLQLARLSLTDAENPDQYARRFSGSDRYVFEFLIEEVIARQPAEIQDFLAVTALFERFCVPLCDFIMGSKSGSHNSRKLITQLERENVFLVPLDSERVWYRYHHLFQDLLMQQLKDNISPKHKVRLHQRAGEWFAGRGLIEEALKYFLAAGDVEKAAELVELNLGDTLDSDPSHRTLLRWLDMFPKSVEKQYPALLVTRVHLKGRHWDFDGMTRMMDDAEAVLRNPACIIPESRRQNLLSEIDAQRGFFLYWNGDVEGALRHTLRALNNTPKEYQHLRFLAVMYAGASYAMTGLREEGLQLLADATAKARSAGSGYAGAYLTVQAGIFYYAGNLAAVKQAVEQILELYKKEAVNVYWCCHAHYFLGAAAYERNHLDIAAVHFQSLEHMIYRTNTRMYHDGLIGLALVALAQGRLAAAREHAVSARNFALEMNDAYCLRTSDSFETRFAIVTGEIPAQPAPHVPTVDSNQLWLETPFLTHVEYLISKANPADCGAALKHVEKALKEVRLFHNTRLLIQLMAVKSVALKSKGKLADALQTLDESLRIAEPLEFVRTFVDRGPPMAELLRALLERSPENSYVRRLLGAFEGKAPASAEEAADEPLSGLLSNREIDVMILLAKRLSNKEIAQRLFVSPETVKTHTSNIYHKLNVSGRRKAVAAARNAGLLSAE